MENKVLVPADLERDFNADDIGKVFWRVESYGALTECLIHDVNEKNEGVIKLKGLTDLRNEEYKLRPLEEQQSWGSSTYGNDVLKKDGFYLDLDEALVASKARFDKEVNPNGDYKVARYFDDHFEVYYKDPVTSQDTFNKKDARAHANRLNSGPRAYVSYRIRAVS